MSCRPATAAIGIDPPDSPLPMTIRSGSTFQCSNAHIFPQRPNPLCTSSMHRHQSCRSHRSRRPGRKSSGGTHTPASPTTGSTRIPAIRDGGTSYDRMMSSMYSSVARPAPPPLFDLSGVRSEEHTSELQSRLHLVCRLLLEKKKGIALEDDVAIHANRTEVLTRAPRALIEL